MPLGFPRIRIRRAKETVKGGGASIASSLPPEILLSIFEHLRRVPPSWTEIMMLVLPEPVPAHVMDFWDDMRAVRLVCRLWHECAAAVLRARADFYTTKHLHRYCRSLENNPTLITSVKSVRMPDDLEDARPPLHPLRRLLRLSCLPVGAAPPQKPTLDHSMADILKQATNATEFILSGSHVMDAFDLCADRIERLQLRASNRQIAHIFDPPVSPIIGPELSRASRVTHLSLHGLVITTTHDLAFPALRHLCLSLSRVPVGWLANTLSLSPLVDVVWLEGSFIGPHTQTGAWNPNEVEPAARRLKELRTDWSLRQLGPTGFRFLANLTFLEISQACVSNLPENVPQLPLPPNVRTLVLSLRKLYAVSRRMVLDSVGDIRRRVPGWKLDQMPLLENLVLSGDAVNTAGLRHWAMASVMLQDLCAGVGVKLRVDVFILRLRRSRPSRR